MIPVVATTYTPLYWSWRGDIWVIWSGYNCPGPPSASLTRTLPGAQNSITSLPSDIASAQTRKHLPGKPVTHNYVLLCTNFGLLWGIRTGPVSWSTWLSRYGLNLFGKGDHTKPEGLPSGDFTSRHLLPLNLASGSF